MPLSDKQLAANRANAAKSTGPKTEGGKRNSSRNATRHGLLAKTILVDGESRDKFHQLLSQFTNDFEPETAYECALVDTMAVAQWRKQRIWAVETASYNHEQRRQPDAVSGQEIEPPTRTMLAVRSIGDQSRHLETISRYEVCYDRQIHRAANALYRLRAEKNARRKRSRQAI